MSQTVLLGDEIELIGGGTPKTSKPAYWGGDIDWLSVVDFGGDSRWVHTAEKKITEEGLNNSSTKILLTGDIIISARGTVGELAQLKKPMAFNQSCYGVRAKGNLNQDYLYYLLKHSIADLQRQAHGGVFSTITRETFNHIKIALPELETQKRIAGILGSIDEKIELNRRMNETLEQMGQALFKKYFIDNPEAKNWVPKSTKEILVIRNGFAFKSRDYVSDGIPVVRTVNFTNNGTILLNEAVYLNNEKAHDYENFQLAKNDLLVVMVGASLGKTAIVPSRILPALQNQNMWCFRAKDSIYQNFVRYQMMQLIKANAGSGSGSAREFFRKDFFYKLRAPFPPNEVIEEFNSSVNNILDKIDINNSQIQDLTSLRDALLPRLISGKLKI